MVNDCIYCKIIRGELPASKINASGKSLAFLDINPHAKGHTLVIPKQHAETLIDLSDEDLLDLWKLVQQVIKQLNKTLQPAGYNIGINMHKAAGQAVEHLHIHILPRWPDDGGGSIHSIIKQPPTESLVDILKQINS